MGAMDGPLRLVGDTAVRIYGLPAPEWQARNWGRAGADRVGGTVLARVDWVLSTALTAALVKRENTALLAEAPTGLRLVAAHLAADGDVRAIEVLMTARAIREEDVTALGLRAGIAETLAGGYDEELRKREMSFALPIEGDGVGAAEEALFRSAYKGATDLVTKYVWPVPALAVTRFCAARRISPNTVTAVSLVFVLIATWAFWHGYWALGFVTGWFMTFLDTVDGKLARTTLTSSRWGHYFDHGIDWIHPPFWYIAWYVAILETTPAPPAWMDAGLTVILLGYVLGRIVEGIFRRVHGFHIHIWRRFDYVLRIVTARRNPNTLIFMVFTLFGAPAAGFGAVAAWTAICVALHTIRLITAGLKQADPPLQSWMAS